MALARASRDAIGNIEQRLERARRTLDEWCRSLPTKEAKRPVYTKERVEEHLRSLREVKVWGDTGFQSEFFQAWLSCVSNTFPSSRDDQDVLVCGAAERIRVPGVLDPVGEGAQASVFRFTENGQQYALRKVLLPDVEARQRFLERVEALSLLRRLRKEEGAKHIYDLQSVGLSETNDDEGIEIYRWVEGTSLERELHRLPAAFVAALGLCLAKSLRVLHKHELLHRDISPRNIILEGAEPVLIDFGLARLGAAEMHTSISSDTAAPEVRGPYPNWSSACDVYSLGATLSQLLMADQDDTRGLRDNALDRCLRQEPRDRPDIDELVSVLENATLQHRVRELQTASRQRIHEAAGADLNYSWFAEVVDKFQSSFGNLSLGLHRGVFDRVADLAQFLYQVGEAHSRDASIGELMHRPNLPAADAAALDCIHKLRLHRSHADWSEDRVRKVLARRGIGTDAELEAHVVGAAAVVAKAAGLGHLNDLVLAAIELGT